MFEPDSDEDLGGAERLAAFGKALEISATQRAGKQPFNAWICLDRRRLCLAQCPTTDRVLRKSLLWLIGGE